MNALVVYCHPCPESYTAAVRDRVLETLVAAGHAVHLVDLYAEGFDPLMGPAERRTYHEVPQNLELVREYADRLAWADALIFVYPTWWFGLPAMLKGWLDRVLVPGFAFMMPTERRGPRPNLTNIRRLGAFTTCGASRLETWLMGEPGRRTILRGVRSVCHPLTRTSFAALYKMDTATEAARRLHLERVGDRVRCLVGNAPLASSPTGPPEMFVARAGDLRDVSE